MKKPLLLVIWILLIEIVIGIVFVSNNWIEVFSEKETSMVIRTLGGETNQWATDKSDGWHRASMIDSGLYEELHYLLIPTKREAENSRGIEKMGEKWFQWWEERLDAFSSYVHQILYRVAILSVWFPYMMILFVPALYDGIMTRKIKTTNFDYSSPIIHRYSLRLVGFLILSLVISLFVPLALEPLIVPVVFMIVCVLIGLSFGNMQKRI